MENTKGEIHVESPIELCLQCHSTLRTNLDPTITFPPNHIPFDHEMPAFKHLFRQVDEELTSCDTALGRLRDIVQEVELKRERMWAMKEQLHGMITPSIRWLPSELLLHIFSMCESPWPIEDFADHAYPNCYAVLQLSHVCSRWRSLAISDPSLWSNIRVAFYVDDDKPTARCIRAFTKLCLERSQTKPLSVYFDTPGDFAWYRNDDDKRIYYPRKLHHRVLTEVVKHIARWKHAMLHLQVGDTIEFPDTLPIIETLQISRAERHDTDLEDLLSASRTISTPLLNRLETWRAGRQVLLSFDTYGLVRLSTHSSHVHVILQVLKDATKLSELHLRGGSSVAPIGRPILRQMPVITSHVRTLVIVDDPEVIHAKQMMPFFEHLCLPRLTTLRVSGSRDFGPSGLLPLIERSRPPVVEMSLKGVSFPTHDLITMFTLLPTITNLELSASRRGLVTDALLQALTLSSTNTSEDSILPNLTDLVLRISGYLERDQPNAVLFVGMAQSRSRTGTAIKRLQSLKFECLKPYADNHPFIAEGLATLSSHGLKSNIVCIQPHVHEPTPESSEVSSEEDE
ncbi:hypothetical protein VNI00_008436 [Paramarasmius palmivorus]|uniref:F-box domain-containing protein n=1 Tax=Paramarasmius palmivorus TaxID=297713 RepID=A0AAW0CWL4_9AGAR